MQKRSTLVILFAVFLVFTGLSLLSEQHVDAQTAGYPTPEEALQQALSAYVEAAGETQTWSLGEVATSGGYSYAIAESADHESNQEGFVVLLARRQTGDLWYAVAPELVPAADYNQWLAETPDVLIDPFSKSFYYQYTPDDFSSPIQPRSSTLQRLPWPIRFEARLTQKDGSYHTNQLDFVIRNSNDIYASKPGLVIFVKEVSDVGGCDMALWPYANMVVVQHTLTEFTWYVHLKQNSATVEVGDLVGYGTKIGEQGNTGFSCGTTGIHLHFMVSNAVPSSWPNPNVPNYAPWPPSGSIYPVDFIEVSYAALAVGQLYTSSNAPPPGICSTTTTGVNLYDNTYCNSGILTTGASGLVNLKAMGLSTNLESIEIPTGWSVALYRSENELGPRLCLNQSDPMLWDNNFSNGEVAANRVSWLRVYQVPGCPYPFEQGIAFYPQANFLGTPFFGMVGERLSSGPNLPVGSIYLPGGYSARIFDADGGTGNTACLAESLLNITNLPGWSGVPIESVELIQGEACEPIAVDVPQPILLTPVNNGTSYSESPEMCWQVEGEVSGLSYNVEVSNSGGTFFENSGWITETCWKPVDLVGELGEFNWRVQAKHTLGDLGPWSVGYSFNLIEDTVAPLAGFRYLTNDSSVSWPRTNLFVNAADGETRVARVHYFAWYDDGSGAGYDWHYIGVDENGSDDWNIQWNVVPVASQDLALWIYAEDLAGNFSSAFISGLTVSSTQTNEGGFEGRETGPGDGGELEGEATGGNQPAPPEENSSPSEESSSSPMTETNDGSTAAPVVTAPKAPQIISPDPGAVFYSPDAVRLCWQPAAGGDLSYRVRIAGDQELTSPWLNSGSCWTPSGLPPSGDFSWNVRARTATGTRSEWSASGNFTLVNDQTVPEVAVLSPLTSDQISGTVEIAIQSRDLESGLYQLQVLAWYDDGAGSAWREIGWISASTEETYRLNWTPPKLSDPQVQLWVYAVDLAGNIGFAQVERLSFAGQDQPDTAIKKALPDVLGRAGSD